MTGRFSHTRTLRGRRCPGGRGHCVLQRAVTGRASFRIDAAAGWPRASARRRWLRSDHVVGRWAGRDRLAGGAGQARPGNRGIPGGRRPGPGRNVRLPQRPEPAARVALVPETTRSASTACLSSSSRRCWTWTRITPTPTLRAIAESGSARRRCLARPETRREWTLDHIGIDRRSGRLRRRRALRPAASASRQPALRLRLREPAAIRAAVGYRRWRCSIRRLLARESSRTRRCSWPRCAPTDHEENWERDRPGFGSPGATDRVSLSCAACHVGRVLVSGKMRFLPGMPNTEIEAQYYSKLLMLTAGALVESGFDPTSTRR